MQKIKYYQNAFLDQMRYQSDPLADKAVSAIFESDRPQLFRKLIDELKHNDYQLPSGLPSELESFMKESRKLPTWADAQLMEKGHTFFRKHAASLTLMLGLLSLPYDYAAAHGAEVLLLSERMRYDTGKRLAETGRYVFDVGAPGSFAAKGSAIASAQKVRLVHASIRYHINKRGGWNGKWGAPINQEDMAGTNLSMSLIPVRGMRKLGIEVSQEESIAYIHLWNVASYIMGVDEKLLPDTSKEAFLLDKMIADRQFKSSEAGRTLTKALLDYINANAGSQLQWVAPKFMRFLLGDEIADILAVPKSTFSESLLMNPLKYWNQVKGAVQGYSDTYYDAQTMYRKNVKSVFKEQKVSINLPKGL